MPALDKNHDAVKNALIEGGWLITDDPYVIEYDDLMLFADLGAERAIAANRGDDQIVVEIKSFIGRSNVREFETALGQFELYRTLLNETDPNRILFLSVPDDVYYDFFQRPAIQIVLESNQVKLLVVNIEAEEIVEWIN